jgi:hypothetical protein
MRSVSDSSTGNAAAHSFQQLSDLMTFAFIVQMPVHPLDRTLHLRQHDAGVTGPMRTNFERS